MPRPDTLRISVIRAQVACLVALLVLTIAATHFVPLTAWFTVKAVALFAVSAPIVIAVAGRSHPFPVFGAANAVTTLRAALTCAVAAALGEQSSRAVASLVVAIAATAAVLDGIDGAIARRSRTSSAFGARFDMEVDAFLILVLAALAWRHGKAGAWVLLSGLLRYFFVAAGWLFDWMRGPLTPTSRARVVCVVQIAALVVIVLPALVPPVTTTLAAVALVTLAWSFAIDVARLWRAARTDSADARHA